MSILRRVLAETIGLPFYSILKHQHISRDINLLRKSWLWSESEIRDYQLDKLKTLLKHAYTRFPFYKNRLNEAGVEPTSVSNLNCLERIPPVSRQDLSVLKSSLEEENSIPPSTVKGTSSGTSGIPIEFYKDSRTLSMGKAALYFGRIVHGWHLGAKTMNVWGNPKTVSILWERPSSKINAFLQNEIRIPACNLNNKQNMEFVTRELFAKKPEFISGYTNSLRSICMYLQSKSLTYNSNGVFTTAETLFESDREIIEGTLGPVTDFYGCSEINGISFQCRHCGLYHTVDPHVITEFEPIAGGGFALLITDLDNHIMPFIRYRVGDIVEPVSPTGSCPSGTSWKTFKSVKGRVSNVISFNGHYINPITYFGDSFGRLLQQKLKSIVSYQSIWTGDTFITEVYIGQTPPEKDIAELNRIQLERLSLFEVGHEFKVILGNPKPPKSGKFSFFVNRAKDTE